MSSLRVNFYICSLILKKMRFLILYIIMASLGLSCHSIKEDPAVTVPDYPSKNVFYGAVISPLLCQKQGQLKRTPVFFRRIPAACNALSQQRLQPVNRIRNDPVSDLECMIDKGFGFPAVR